MSEPESKSRDLLIAAIDTEDKWYLNTGKLLITLNSGSIVALLAMSQALLANGHFGLLKPYLLSSLAIFLIGVCSGVAGFNSRRLVWSATIARAVPYSAVVLESSLSTSIVSLAVSFVLFMAGAIVIGVGMAAKL